MKRGRKKFQWQQKLLGITPTEDLRAILAGLGFRVENMPREHLYDLSVSIVTDKSATMRAERFVRDLLRNLEMGLHS